MKTSLEKLDCDNYDSILEIMFELRNASLISQKFSFIQDEGKLRITNEHLTYTIKLSFNQHDPFIRAPFLFILTYNNNRKI